MVKITKAIAAKWLGEVEPEKQFWCHDGRVLKTLAELEMALDEMSDETFLHHASGDKNDFSNWVRDVIGDDKLAADLAASTDRYLAAGRVASRITSLKSKAAGR
jgi:hypothetical protein